ncbi:MAG: SDR family oxidoreductase [Chloroflexota bacterium]|nr:MAG: SDR family oxidoreductase [Chloroflexota bacterium]
MGKLDGKIAVVTGAGSGIGRQISLLFSGEGAKVVVADVDLAMAKATVESIAQSGGQAIPTRTDVSSALDVQELFGTAVRQFGTLHVLVNNAGIVVRKRFEDYTEEDWDRTYRVNLKGFFLCSKYAVPIMREAGGGKIVAVASISADVGYGPAPYCASKGAIEALARQMAAELAASRINVNCISPGTTETAITADTLGNPVIRTGALRLMPLGRFGLPMDLAKAALFLASEDAEFITGVNLPVDGGQSSSRPLAG